MKITIVGRGNIGGGLARLWSAAGHEVTALGREGGDASAADILVVAVPGDSVAEALDRVTGIAGKPVIDATNVYGPRTDTNDSNAHLVKSLTGGPVAKSFSVNFASEYSKIAAQATPPANLFASDPEIRRLVEQLNRDAGFDPIYVGDLGMARLLEDAAPLFGAVAGEGLGPYFYRFTPRRS